MLGTKMRLFFFIYLEQIKLIFKIEHLTNMSFLIYIVES